MKKIDLKTIKAKIEEIKAYCDEPCDVTTCCNCDGMTWEIDYLKSELSYLYRYLSNLESALYQHAHEGHLPPIIGPEKLTKALKALGLDGDYEVQKRQIWASTGKLQNTEIVLKSK